MISVKCVAITIILVVDDRVMHYLYASERYDPVSLRRPIDTVIDVAPQLLLAHRELYVDLC
jgi:hypothetical protein